MISDQILEQLKALVEKEIERGARQGAGSAAEGLNQTIRRLRTAEGESDVTGLLSSAAAAYAKRIACLLFETDLVKVATFRGICSAPAPFLIHDSPSLLSAIESHDTVVASATARELSEALFTATESSTLTEPKAYLVPVVVHGSVRMVLFAAEEVQPAFLEIICAVAAQRLEAMELESAFRAVPNHALQHDAPQYDAPHLVQIGGAHSASPKWNELDAAEQTLHLRAQRFAQVAVARMRVDRNDAVREGQQRGDLYSALRPEIDAARNEYKSQFLNGQSKTMVDYLYLELVRSLANDEDRLLGSGFPGRLT